MPATCSLMLLAAGIMLWCSGVPCSVCVFTENFCGKFVTWNLVGIFGSFRFWDFDMARFPGRFDGFSMSFSRDCPPVFPRFFEMKNENLTHWYHHHFSIFQSKFPLQCWLLLVSLNNDHRYHYGHVKVYLFCTEIYVLVNCLIVRSSWNFLQ